MKKSIIKSLLAGIIAGALIFFTGPFLLLFTFIVLTLKFIFTPFGMGRMMMMGGYGHLGHWRHSYAFADKIRNMSEEEFSQFQNRMNARYKGCSDASN
jgi:predicted membrane protein